MRSNLITVWLSVARKTDNENQIAVKRLSAIVKKSFNPSRILEYKKQLSLPAAETIDVMIREVLHDQVAEGVIDQSLATDLYWMIRRSNTPYDMDGEADSGGSNQSQYDAALRGVLSQIVQVHYGLEDGIAEHLFASLRLTDEPYENG